jgi:hypothetical protein
MFYPQPFKVSVVLDPRVSVMFDPREPDMVRTPLPDEN